MCTFFTIDKYYYVFLKCVNKDIITIGVCCWFACDRTWSCKPDIVYHKRPFIMVLNTAYNIAWLYLMVTFANVTWSLWTIWTWMRSGSTWLTVKDFLLTHTHVKISMFIKLSLLYRGFLLIECGASSKQVSTLSVTHEECVVCMTWWGWQSRTIPTWSVSDLDNDTVIHQTKYMQFSSACCHHLVQTLWCLKSQHHLSPNIEETF